MSKQVRKTKRYVVWLVNTAFLAILGVATTIAPGWFDKGYSTEAPTFSGVAQADTSDTNSGPDNGADGACDSVDTSSDGFCGPDPGE